MQNLTLEITYNESYNDITIYIGSNSISEKVGILRGFKTKQVMGYRTTDGNVFEFLNDAIEHQIEFSANHAPLDNFLVVYRKNFDSPFFTKGLNSQDRFKYLYNKEEIPNATKPLIYVKYDYEKRIDVVTNFSGKTLLIVDESKDNVILLPHGNTVELLR